MKGYGKSSRHAKRPDFYSIYRKYSNSYTPPILKYYSCSSRIWWVYLYAYIHSVSENFSHDSTTASDVTAPSPNIYIVMLYVYIKTSLWLAHKLSTCHRKVYGGARVAYVQLFYAVRKIEHWRNEHSYI